MGFPACNGFIPGLFEDLASVDVFCPSTPATLRCGQGARDRPARLPSVGVAMNVTPRLTGWLAPMLAVLALSVAAPHALAQMPAPAPAPQSAPAGNHASPPAASREDLQNMLDTLHDPAKRDALAQQIETLLQLQQQQQQTVPPEDQGPGARMLDALSTGFQQFSQFMEEVGRSFGASGHLLAWFEIQGSDPRLRAMWLDIGEDVAVSLGAGALAALAVGYAVKAGRRRLAARAGDRLFRRFRLAAERLVLGLLPVIAFGVVALVIAGWVSPQPTARLALLAFINATLISFAGAVIARFLFSPMEPELRLFPLNDSTAAY